MKLSEQWLREWVKTSKTIEQISQQLTMAGLETEALQPASAYFEGVICGEIVKIALHPTHQHLSVCEINAGEENYLQVVTAATNIYTGLKVAVALAGAKLPGDIQIEQTDFHGVLSEGMLCSQGELKFVETADVREGIWQLPDDIAIGVDLWRYGQFEDQIVEVSLTPNRGDCLSIQGIAREVAALNATKIITPDIPPVTVTGTITFPVIVTAKEACSHYAGRVIRQVNSRKKTPLWLQERLRRSGLRSISVIVDIINYVMLELGQPMHAFDFAMLQGQIEVRKAYADEKLTLLNDQEVQLRPNTLVIADKKQPLAIAGIMGGLASSVTENTCDILLESACFIPSAIIGRARQYGLHTDASHRFERGVDPKLQIMALERATQLILQIAGGEANPIFNVATPAVSETRIISLRNSRINQVLGFELSEDEAVQIFQRLGCTVYSQGSSWEIMVPSYRYDLFIEEDLIEELARLYGYDRVPVKPFVAPLKMHPVSENKLKAFQLMEVLTGRGYYEAITYSFVDPNLQQLIDPSYEPLMLTNPIALELSQMRTTLWPGLLQVLLYNQNRQQTRLRLFEIGLRFISENKSVMQEQVIAGIIAGTVYPEQWDSDATRSVDLFDMKSDVEALLELTGRKESFHFESAQHPALHPGQSARIMRGEKKAGWLGLLHPAIQQQLGIANQVVLFELLLSELDPVKLPQYKMISRYPCIRRDISFLIDAAVPAADVLDTIRRAGSKLLRRIEIFDVYQGKEVVAGKKSMAVGLVLQHPARTLIDEEINQNMEEIIVALKKAFAMVLRD